MVDRSAELAIPSIREAFDAFLALSPQEFGILLGVIMWAGLLWLPLSRIDRRDRIAQASYAVFMAFAASCLILAANRYLVHVQQAAPAMLLVVVFTGVGALRWLIVRTKPSSTKKALP